MNNQYADSSSLGRDQSINRSDVFHYPHFAAEKTRHRGKNTGDTLGLVSVEAELEILLVAHTCVGLSLPSTALDKCLYAVPTSESLSWRRFYCKRAITTCLLPRILYCVCREPLCKV